MRTESFPLPLPAEKEESSSSERYAVKKKNFPRRKSIFFALTLIVAAAVAVAVATAAKGREHNKEVLLQGELPEETHKGALAPEETDNVIKEPIDSTSGITEVPTETDPVTESATEPPTEPATQPSTEPATQPSTEPSTEAPTEPVTQAATEPVTDAPPSGEANFFDSSLFIGDSRTVGLNDYANLGKASVFASLGMNVYRVFKEPVDVPGHGKVMLADLLSNESYNKIYIMLGINEIGYPAESVLKKYGEIVESVRAAQPDATVYLLANLHITAERSANDAVYNNTNLNALNLGMQQLADGTKTVYIDANYLFDDENGGLKKEYAIDDFHLIGRYYAVWADWIAKNS